MKLSKYFHNCSRDYVESISPELANEVADVIGALPRRQTQAELNEDISAGLAAYGWSFDSIPKHMGDLKSRNDRSLCLTSSTLGAGWRSDFAKRFDSKLVQLEVQFGKVEAMFKDFCGFRIAYYERRLALGIAVVMCNPYEYFAHRKASVSGMAYFDIAKRTLPAIGLDCPIWLLGIPSGQTDQVRQ